MYSEWRKEWKRLKKGNKNMIIELTNTEAEDAVIAIAKQTSSLDALVTHLPTPKWQSIISRHVESLKSVTNKISCQFHDCDILADKPDQEQSTSQISSDALPVPPVAKPVKQPADAMPTPTPPEGFEIISSPGAVNNGEGKNGDLWWSDSSQKWIAVCAPFVHFSPLNIYARIKQPDVAQQGSIKTEDLNVATIQRQRDEIASLRKDVEKYFCNRTVLLADYAELKDQRNEFVRFGGILAAVAARDYVSNEGKLWWRPAVNMMIENWNSAVKSIKEGK
jgi:hypothetical protein